MADERDQQIRELASKPTWDIDVSPELNALLDKDARAALAREATDAGR